MHIETFLKHWNIQENPFQAEEARDDPVFQRLIDHHVSHPDFEKIYGNPEQPGAAVVFGEKGSGKTALRLLIHKKLKEHNELNPKKSVWAVHYDDLNPVLDRFTHNTCREKKEKNSLEGFRLEDHMDAILSIATTRLIDMLQEPRTHDAKTKKIRSLIRKMPRQKRFDLAVLAILYDQPVAGNPQERWAKLGNLLRCGKGPGLSLRLHAGLLTLVLNALFAIGIWGLSIFNWPVIMGFGVSAFLAIVLFASWSWRHMKLRKLVRQIRKEIFVIDRDPHQILNKFGQLPIHALESQPIPVPGGQDSRYQLTVRLLHILKELGYIGMTIMVDRIDEPTLVKGDPSKMKTIVWPLLDNKFLQQEFIGVKLLLPIELRHLLRREDAWFFQKARLDKQHLIDPLTWSGSTLYDLCNHRLAICKTDGAPAVALVDLFEDDVSQQDIIEALDQMNQPRDAFKLIYQVLQEHGLHSSEQNPCWQIPKLTLEHVRRQQRQRVEELHRGLGPA
ncbi:MAG: hypothetical protein GKR87_15860 [Kiritimatiellae bacterium]|nr:hypothetical protein [Kiritimatiellia bacterium]